MLESQHKGSNAPSVRSLAMDAERLRPGHWLGLVFYAPLSAMTLSIGWQKGHVTLKNNLCHFCRNVFFLERVEKEN